MKRKRTRTGRLSRRTFLGTAMAGTAALGFPHIVPGRARAVARGAAVGKGGRTAPSNRIAVGCIGVGPQGNGVMNNFLRRRDARVVAVCDVQAPRRDATKQRVDAHYGDTGCATYNDFRDLVARDDIDAVLIASTDHWHVLHGLAAARAGKDMYIEKPLGLSLAENRALRDAVRDHGCIFQFGTQQRSSGNFRFACELVQNGRIGALERIRVGAPASHAAPNFPPMPVPDWLDYDLWLGQAPEAPYTEKRIINDFWWHISDYALGFVAGWGIHHVDIAQWGNAADTTGPVEIEGAGVFPEDGMCNCAVSWNIDCAYANGVRMNFTDNGQNPQGVIFEGSEGKVYVRRGYIEADPPALLRAPIEPGEIHLYESNDHVGNFLDCIRSRATTVCPIETAVRSDTVCHLSDIAMRTGRKLHWDPKAERFIGDDGANRMLSRAMRSPWTL